MPVLESTYTSCASLSPPSLFLHIQRLDIPNTLRILLDASITAEETHPRNAGDAFTDPAILILERLINQILRLAVRPEIVRHQIVITVLDNGVDERGERGLVTKHALVDSIEYFLQLGIELVITVVVGVAQVFNIFG